jgi:shikimate kinase
VTGPEASGLEASGLEASGPEASGPEASGPEASGPEADGPPARPAAILIGPPGAGKSTVGPLLAARLAVAFADTDSQVEATAGKPVSEVFIEDGEEAFRALERDAVASAVAAHRGVLGLGGGAIMDPGTRAVLAGQLVVYLETGFAEAAKRVGLDRPRPLLAGNPRAQLRALLEQRLPVYQQLATITVSTDHRAPDAIADDIAARLAAGDSGAGDSGAGDSGAGDPGPR